MPQQHPPRLIWGLHLSFKGANRPPPLTGKNSQNIHKKVFSGYLSFFVGVFRVIFPIFGVGPGREILRFPPDCPCQVGFWPCCKGKAKSQNNLSSFVVSISVLGSLPFFADVLLCLRNSGQR